MYCATVSVIDCSHIEMTPEIKKIFQETPDIGLTEDSHPNEWERLLETYQPALIEVLIPILRRRHPNLIRVHFGAEYGPKEWNGVDIWSVHITPMAIPFPGPTSPDIAPTPRIGWIDHYQTLDGGYHFPALASLDRHMPTLAPDGYNLRTRFNLHVLATDGLEKVAWLRALENDPLLSHIHTSIVLLHLPIDLAGLATLYTRQTQAGHSARLQTIYVTEVVPFPIEDFLLFAKVASTSLSVLYLLNEDHDIHITFDDIPQLAMIIRIHLPNLVELSLGMMEIGEAETTCKGMLNTLSFEGDGNIELLRIYTRRALCPLFNTSRVLASLLVGGSQFELYAGKGRDAASTIETEETRFVKYLRA